MKKRKDKLVKILFIITSILFAMPSIIYIMQKKTILQFDIYFQFLYDAQVSRATQTILYIVILSILAVTYFVIIKKRQEIFKDIKKMFIFIAIVALIFVAVLPFTSSDIFYYLGVGRIDSTYHQNPYYTTIKEFVEQEKNSEYLRNRYSVKTRI